MYVDKKNVENQRMQAIQFINNFEGIGNKIEEHTKKQQKDDLLSLLKELRNSSLKLGSDMLRDVVEMTMTNLVVDNDYQSSNLIIEVVEEIRKSLKDIVEE